MTLEQYEELSHLTANPACKIKEFYTQAPSWIYDLDHAARGLCTEAGEFNDITKRYFIYGKEIDQIHAAEEIGDILWYASLACKALGIPMVDIMRMNIEKLKIRYPNLYNQQDAINRNLNAERQKLEER
jgi:NTP pyrophosphatase (non-canonical NTP hydrolase)